MRKERYKTVKELPDVLRFKSDGSARFRELGTILRRGDPRRATSWTNELVIYLWRRRERVLDCGVWRTLAEDRLVLCRPSALYFDTRSRRLVPFYGDAFEQHRAAGSWLEINEVMEDTGFRASYAHLSEGDYWRSEADQVRAERKAKVAEAGSGR